MGWEHEFRWVDTLVLPLHLADAAYYTNVAPGALQAHVNEAVDPLLA